MDPISIGLAVANIGTNILGGLSAKDKAEEAFEQQARLTFFQRQEEIRRQRRQFREVEGAGRALAYASGVRMTSTGSTRRYLDSMQMEHRRQLAHAQRAAHLERRAIEKGAAGVGSSLFAQAAGDTIGLLANMYTNRAQPTAYTVAPTNPGQAPSNMPTDLSVKGNS